MGIFLGVFVVVVAVCFILLSKNLQGLDDEIYNLETELKDIRDELKRREGCAPDFFKDIHPTARVESNHGKEWPLLVGDKYTFDTPIRRPNEL